MPMFARGLSDTEAACSASLACTTVRGHRHNLMRKIGIHSYAQLVCWCVMKGFLPVAPPELPFDGEEPHTEQRRLNVDVWASQAKKTVRSD
ncbi:MAG: LuxR C-terminal-related transcriptional regulator [Opitutaceae bacterium]